MKRIVFVILLLSLIGVSQRVQAQISNRDWVMVGIERMAGSYSGISPILADDQYKLQNPGTWRFEFVKPKRIIHIDVSWLTMKMIRIGYKYAHSTFTENRLHEMQNRTNARFGVLYLLGKDNTKSSSFCLGWQADWRYFGIPRLSAPGDDGYNVGCLEQKDRIGLGINGGWVKQFSNWAYTRILLNADYSPGKVSSFSIYPEWMALFHYGNLGVYSLLTYRVDRLMGNTNTSQTVQPLEATSVHRVLRFELGLVIDGGFHGK